MPSAGFLTRAKEANEGCERDPEETKHGEPLYQNAGRNDGRYVIDSKAGRSFGEAHQIPFSSGLRYHVEDIRSATGCLGLEVQERERTQTNHVFWTSHRYPHASVGPGEWLRLSEPQ